MTDTESPPKKRPPKLVPVKHRWLDQWLTAKGEPLRQLVSSILALVDRYESENKVRKRARRAADQTRYEKMAEIVVANLAYAVLCPPPTGRTAVDIRHGEKGVSRYNNAALSSRILGPFLDNFLMLDIIDGIRPPMVRGEKSSIAPHASFVTRVRERGITLGDFGRDLRQELIILNRNTRSSFNPFAGGPGERKRERVEYRESPDTTALRDRMVRINDWLAQADVTFVHDVGPVVDHFDRIMRRMFVITGNQTQRFDQSGRLFGGFWQGLESERRQGIRINGEHVADLDFSSMFTRLAYTEVNVVPPKGDLYAIPGLEGYRSGVKMAMNAFLFATSPKKQWPKELGIGVGDDDAAANGELPAAEYEARLPAGWSVQRMREAVLSHHPALRPVLEQGIGYRLMYLESEVLLLALEKLMARDIPALGLHDGLLCPASQAAEVAAVLEAASKAVVGVQLPVTIKH